MAVGSVGGIRGQILIGIRLISIEDWTRYEAKSLFAVSESESCPNPISAGGRSVGLRELFGCQAQIESDFRPAAL